MGFPPEDVSMRFSDHLRVELERVAERQAAARREFREIAGMDAGLATIVVGIRAHDGTPSIIGTYPDGVAVERGDLKCVLTGDFVLQGVYQEPWSQSAERWIDKHCTYYSGFRVQGA